MTPQVSVIIPTFNRREMTVEAVRSVLAQRNASFELIVVDDGSTDGTADAVEEAVAGAGAPVSILRTENRGAAAARNAGAARAKAPLLAFLDSDDLWMPNKLSRQIADWCDHPEWMISQCNEIWIRNGRRVNPGLRHRKRAGDIFIDSLHTCLISPSAVIMSAGLFHEVGGFDEAMRAAEDYDLWLRILLHHEVGLLEEDLVMRRAGHDGQLSVETAALDRFRVLALAKLLNDQSLTGAKRAATAQVMAQKCRILAGGLRRRGRGGELYEAIAESAQNNWSNEPDAVLGPAIRELRARIDDAPAPAKSGIRSKASQ